MVISFFMVVHRNRIGKSHRKLKGFIKRTLRFGNSARGPFVHISSFQIPIARHRPKFFELPAGSSSAELEKGGVGMRGSGSPLVPHAAERAGYPNGPIGATRHAAVR